MDNFTYGHNLWTICYIRYLGIHICFDDILDMWITVVKCD